jgi:hypothetical protein
MTFIGPMKWKKPRKKLKKPNVTVTINLFLFGIVLFRKELKNKI